MALDTATRASEQTVRPGRHRGTAALFVTGGLVLAAGGQTHPRGTGDTVDAHLLSMFSGPTWGLSHLLLLLGSVLCAMALWSAGRATVFAPRVRRWLPLALGAWAFGALETIPHLMAAGEAHALEHHKATPVLDLHVVLQLVATPVVGLATAVVAVAVARSERTVPARLLAVVAAVSGVAYAAAGPLVVGTGNPQLTVLFPFLAGLALWFVATGIRIARR
jgi:hypothetical protein